MTLAELKARLDALKSDMQAEIDAGLPDQGKFDQLETEAKDTRAKIERIEKFQAEHAKDQAGTGRATKASSPVSVTVRDNSQDDPTAGFGGIGEFGRAVMSACTPGADMDQRLRVLGAPTNFHRETGSSDGYMVPPQFRDAIFELMFGEPDLLSMVDGEPTNSNSVQFIADETTPWGSTGVQAYWGGEGNQFTASRLDTEGREIKLHKLHAFVTATEELIEDAPRLNDRLTRGAARALNWKANNAIHYGTGAGQPLGFNTAASKVTVAKEGSQTADTVVAKNVAKMYARNLNPGRAVWIINQDVIPEIMTLTIGDQPVWTPPASGFTQAPGGFLLGRPVMFSDQCKTLGDEGDILFVDPMGYYLARKSSGIKFGSSMHLYFDYDVQAFRWTFRLGGQPYLSAAVSPANGSATRGHYITLAVRS
jgi:HK97 family phage major capsid protein